MDHSARAPMKNAASCENQCELQNAVIIGISNAHGGPGPPRPGPRPPEGREANENRRARGIYSPGQTRRESADRQPRGMRESADPARNYQLQAALEGIAELFFSGRPLSPQPARERAAATARRDPVARRPWVHTGSPRREETAVAWSVGYRLSAPPTIAGCPPPRVGGASRRAVRGRPRYAVEAAGSDDSRGERGAGTDRMEWPARTGRKGPRLIRRAPRPQPGDGEAGRWPSFPITHTHIDLRSGERTRWI